MRHSSAATLSVRKPFARVLLTSTALIAVSVVLAGQAYKFALAKKNVAHGKTALQNYCDPSSPVTIDKKQNPNKLLFMTCGGFLVD